MTLVLFAMGVHDNRKMPTNTVKDNDTNIIDDCPIYLVKNPQRIEKTEPMSP
jgi:hypothetical protein